MKEYIYSRNAVYETLRAKRRQGFQLLMAEGNQSKERLDQINQLAAARRIPVIKAPRQRLDSISEGHQGVILQASGYPYSTLEAMLDLAAQREEPPFLLVLDALQDPQNLGTLLRTAEAVGVHGVLLPLAHTATVTPAVVNASSGASEHLLITQVNLAQAIDRLKAADVWIAGLDGSPDAQPVQQARWDGALALVVGSEGEGMRPLTRKLCDWRVRLPMRGEVESLNAAVAGSLALYLAWGQRGYRSAR